MMWVLMWNWYFYFVRISLALRASFAASMPALPSAC